MRASMLMAGGVLIVALTVLAGWWVAAERKPETTGVVSVTASSPVRAPQRSQQAATSPVAMAPATAPLANDPDQLLMKSRGEARDVAWAARSEAVIFGLLRTVPQVGRGRPLDIKCAASLCEVSGVAASNDSWDAVQQAWIELNQAMRDPVLAEAGLVPVASNLGTARDMAGFTIYFRRAGR